MAALKTKLSALFVAQETTFATDPDADGSDYKHIKSAFDMTFNPMQDVVERSGLTNDMTRQPHAIGAKSWTLNFKLEVKGGGTITVDETPAVAAEADPILQSLFGTVTRGTGSAITGSGSTTTVLNVEAGDGAGFAKGMLIFVNCGATYGYVPRFIASIATDALTLNRALPAIPATAAAVQASSLYTRANTGHKGLAFVATKDTVQYTLLGGKIDSAKISGITARGTAIFEFALTGSDWNKTTKASLPSTALTGITAVKAPIIKASCFAIGGTEEHAHSLELDFNHVFNFQDSTCALGPAQPDSANAGVELTDAAPGGAVKLYYADAHITDFVAGTERALDFVVPCQPGATGANGWGVYIPKAQWLQPQFEDHNGMVAQSMPFKVNDNGADSELYFCVA